MSKINIKHTLNELSADARSMASDLAMISMAVATIIGMTEITDRQDIKVVAAQPAYAFAGSHANDPIRDNVVRSEREDIAHSAVSYGLTMRSEAISGKR